MVQTPRAVIMLSTATPSCGVLPCVWGSGSRFFILFFSFPSYVSDIESGKMSHSDARNVVSLV